MKVSTRASFAALMVALSLFFLFQNCAPAKITASDSEILVPTDNADLGSSAPPSSTPSPTPVGTPGATPIATPIATPTPVPGPAVTLSTTLLDFGTQSFGGMSPAKIVKITNSGTASLRITSKSINPTDFYEDNFSDTCTGLIAPGQSCNIGVRFDPFGTGTTTGLLRIESNAINSPSLVQLQGKSSF